MSVTLSLTNFKRYDIKTTFNFSSSGLILLQGASGIGKTSILDAIYFVLYGIGQKIVNFNANSCNVVWDDGHTIITRSKKPNRLTLRESGILYEDSIAQEIINKRFGIDFEITSYIKYKASTSFFSLGPSARMEFLQKIAIKGTDVHHLKLKTKEAIKKRREHLLMISSELRVIENEFKSLDILQEVKFPFGKYNELKIKNHKIKSKNNKIKLSNIEKVIKQTLKRSKHYYLTKQANEFIKIRVDEYIRELGICENNFTTMVYKDTSELQKILTILQSNIQYNDLQQQLQIKKIQYEECKKAEDIQREQEMNRLLKIPVIQNNLHELGKNNELKNNIIEVNKRLQLNIKQMEKYNNINEDELEKLNKYLENSLGKKYICPNCSHSVLLKDEILHIYSQVETDEINISLIKKQISQIKQQLREKSSLQAIIDSDINFLQLHKDFNTTIEYEKMYNEHLQHIKKQEMTQLEIGRLKNQTYSQSVITLERDINKTQKLLEKCNYVEIQTDYTDIDILKNLIYDTERSNEKYRELQNKISLLRTSISQEKDKFLILEDENYIEKIQQLEKDVIDLKTEISKNEEDNIKLTEYLQYKEQLHIYDKWKTKLEDVKLCELNAVKSLEVAEKFLTIVNETESKAVLNVINSINIHLKYYSEQFFSEPISIQIQPFKECYNGNTKPSIYISVSYKGMDYDVDCLSGGETSRVELAVCLSINNIINGKILLLDEVLGTLNSGYIETITNVLREEALKCNKLIITILHGANEGNFDQVINVE